MPPAPARRRRSVAVGTATVFLGSFLVTRWGAWADPIDSTADQFPAWAHAVPLKAAPSAGVKGAATPSAWSTAFLNARLPTPASRFEGAPVVYLTFDDGPSPLYTAALLAILLRHDARATFFVIGGTAAAFPDLVRMEIQAGHSIGGHSWTHPHLTTLSVSAITAQLVSTRDLIRRLGAPARCFRPPYGQTDSKVAGVARGLHLRTYLWTTASNDFTRASASADLQRAMAGLHPGAVIAFHDWVPQSLVAVDQFLTIADQRGYVAAALPC